MLLGSAATALTVAWFFKTVATQNETNTTPCNFCPEGLPDEYKFSKVLNMTCGEMATYAKLTSYPVCEAMLLPAAIECDCSYENPKGRCDICPDGLEYPDDIASSASETMPYNNLTCSGLVGLSKTSDDGPVCDFYGAIAATDCGCPLPEGYVLCDVPRDAVPEPGRFSDDLNMTCGEFADLISNGPAPLNYQCDAWIDILSSFCGPEPYECAFCPRGYELQYPNAIYDNETNAVCSDFVLNLKTPESDNSATSCDAARSNFISTGAYPYPCGFCVPTNSSPDRCDMCADGFVPTSAAEDPAIPNGDGSVMSCGQLFYQMALQSPFLKTSTFLGDVTCVMQQDAVAIACGCSAETSEEPCSVCEPDGPAYPDVAMENTPQGVINCGQSSEVVTNWNISRKSLTCTTMQHLADEKCGCSPPDVETCGLCPGGMTVSGYTQTSLGQNCIWLENYLLGVPADHRLCKKGAPVFAAECCPEMCNPCPNGLTVSKYMVTEIDDFICGALSASKFPATDALCVQNGPIIAEACCPPPISDTGSVDDSASKHLVTDGNITDSLTNNTNDANPQLELSSDAVSFGIAGNIIFAAIGIAFLF